MSGMISRYTWSWKTDSATSRPFSDFDYNLKVEADAFLHSGSGAVIFIWTATSPQLGRAFAVGHVRFDCTWADTYIHLSETNREMVKSYV